MMKKLFKVFAVLAAIIAAGVYYYVIQAEGADGKEYKLNGDINIINYKETENSTNNSGEGVIE